MEQKWRCTICGEEFEGDTLQKYVLYAMWEVNFEEIKMKK